LTVNDSAIRRRGDRRTTILQTGLKLDWFNQSSLKRRTLSKRGRLYHFGDVGSENNGRGSRLGGEAIDGGTEGLDVKGLRKDVVHVHPFVRFADLRGEVRRLNANRLDKLRAGCIVSRLR
jgi:hypothetical protein